EENDDGHSKSPSDDNDQNQSSQFSQNGAVEGKQSLQSVTVRQSESSGQIMRIRNLTSEQVRLRAQIEQLELALQSTTAGTQEDIRLRTELEQCRSRWSLYQTELHELYLQQLERQKAQLDEEERAAINSPERLQHVRERRKHWKRIYADFQARQSHKSDSSSVSRSSSSNNQHQHQQQQ